MTPKWSAKSIKPSRDWPGFGVLLGIIFGILAKRAQDGARVAQEGAKMAQDRPKTGLRWPKIGPRRPKMAWIEKVPIWPKTGPRQG